MRRASLLAGMLALGFLAVLPSLAAGAAGAADRELNITLDIPGFTGFVHVSNNDGDVDATIFFKRGPQIAYYSAPAQVSADRVTARFGALGELDYRFAPKPEGKFDCGTSETREAVFEGTLRFTGERGYIHIDAPRSEGVYRVEPAPNDCPAGLLAQRTVPYTQSYSSKGATLKASAGSRGKGRIRELAVVDAGQSGPHRVGVSAMLAEARGRLVVVRGVILKMGSGAFRWSLEEGTAQLRPPAPFSGRATFTRSANRGPGKWTGSLRMPILGGDPVRLTGAGFQASLRKGVPQDR